MKNLVVYYSRSGNTKKIAEEISKKLKSEILEIKSAKSYKGAVGWLRAGFESSKKKTPKIKSSLSETQDLVIIGTPVWAWTLASPVRSFLIQNQKKIKKVAFFCTYGGSKDMATFQEMESLSKKPISTLKIKTRDVQLGNYGKELDSFCRKLK